MCVKALTNCVGRMCCVIVWDIVSMRQKQNYILLSTDCVSNNYNIPFIFTFEVIFYPGQMWLFCCEMLIEMQSLGA